MIFIDSDCIIDFLRGKKEVVNIIDKHKEELVTTEINIFEVFAGIYKSKEIKEKKEQIAKAFFESLDILDCKNFGRKGALIFCELIKEGKEIEQNDCLIAASLLINNCDKIITRNTKHFSRIKGLKIIKY